MKAAIYARVSTKDQNPELQIRELKAYCEARRWQFKIYLDTISGAERTRPELGRLEKDAYGHKFAVVLVWRFDRFARGVGHLLQALDRFNTLGIGFVSLRDGIDTTTTTGRLLFTIVAAIAEFERNIIRERVRAGIENAKAKGKTLGRPRVAVDAELIRRWRKQGLSWSAIVKKTGLGKGTCQRAVKVYTSTDR